MKSIRYFSHIFFVAVLLPSVYAAEVSEEIVKTFDMKKDAYIIVIGDEGAITINSWDREAVKLRMVKRAWSSSERQARELLKALDVDIQHSTDRLAIRQIPLNRNRNISFWDLFDPDEWDKFRNSSEIIFDLTVPRNSNLRLETDEGDVTVNTINGSLDIEVDEGDVSLQSIRYRDMQVTVDEGDFSARSIHSDDGKLDIEADEGEISLEQSNIGRLHIVCDEGDIDIHECVIDQMDITADEGDIHLELDPADGGRYTIETDEGDVDIWLPNHPNVNVRLETEDGNIRTDFKLDIQKSKDDDWSRARGKLGNGNASIRVYTDEGRISLRAQ